MKSVAFLRRPSAFATHAEVASIWICACPTQNGWPDSWSLPLIFSSSAISRRAPPASPLRAAPRARAKRVTASACGY